MSRDILNFFCALLSQYEKRMDSAIKNHELCKSLIAIRESMQNCDKKTVKTYRNLHQNFILR